MIWFWFLMFLTVNFVINSMLKISNRVELYSYREVEISEKYREILKKIDILLMFKNLSIFSLCIISFLLGLMYLSNVLFINLLWYIVCVGVIVLLYSLWFNYYTKKHDFVNLCKKLEKRWKEEKIFSDYHDEEVKVVRGVKEGYDIGIMVIVLIVFVLMCLM